MKVKRDEFNIFQPGDPVGGMTQIVPLGGEAHLRFEHTLDGCTGAWLALQKQKAAPELVPLPGVTGATIVHREQERTLQGGGGTVVDRIVVFHNAERVEASAQDLSDAAAPEAQAALRMLRSLGRRPGDYGATAEDVRRQAVETTSGLLAMLPVDTKVGKMKRSLSREQLDTAIHQLSSRLGEILVRACVADTGQTDVVGVRMSLDLREWLETNAAARGESLSHYTATLLEQVRERGLAR